MPANEASNGDEGGDDEGSGEGAPNAIVAASGYAPRYRLDADEIADAWGSMSATGVNAVAVPGPDEDALTMAYEAAASALAASEYAGASVARFAFASTTPPVDEEDPAPRLGSMLGVDEHAVQESYGASTRAGTRALAAGLDANLEADEVAVVVAADCPQGEPGEAEGQGAGSGAAAFVLSPGNGANAVARGTAASPYPGTRFRERGSDRIEGLGVTSYDREAFRETLSGAVDALEDETDGPSSGEPAGVSSVDAAAIQAPDGGLPYRAAGALGVESEAIQRVATVHDLGDTGAASPLLGLALALDDDDVERTLVAGYGSGAGADAFLVDTDSASDGDGDGAATALAIDRTDATEVSYPEMLRLREEITPGPPDGGGAYVSLPSWKRTLAQRHRLIAGRCRDCGALAFPPLGACGSCRARAGFDDVALPGTGTVEAVTTISQGGAPPEFATLQQRGGDYDVAVVALDGPEGGHDGGPEGGQDGEPDDGRDGEPEDGHDGGSGDGTDSVSVPAQVTDVDAGVLEVGDAVSTTIRRIYTQEGVTRYGFKVRPVGER